MIIESRISRMQLDTGDVVRLPNPAGATVASTGGRIWLTQDNDGRDVVLSEGQCFEPGPVGAVVISALEAGVVTIIPAGFGREALVPANGAARGRNPELLPDWDRGVGAWMPAWPSRA